MNRIISTTVLTTGWFLLSILVAAAQPARSFDFSLGIDYSAAEKMIDYFDYRTSNSQLVAGIRGNRLAAATSIMLSRTEKDDDDFRLQLELARNNSKFQSDIYGFSAIKKNLPELRKLLLAVQQRQLDRRIVATLESYFPFDAKISTRFSVYFVVFGNERAAAYVRHVVWNYDVPTFVGEEEGEPIIVVNLSRIMEISNDVESQFRELLSVTAHECFHAICSVLQKSLPESAKPANIQEHLMYLVQNEGIAYYLSMQTHIGSESPSRDWFYLTSQTIETLNSVLKELSRPNLTEARARELIMNANLSGSFEGNYGATAGLRMAYEIDKNLGRPALTQTLMTGGYSFFLEYQKACRMNSVLPKIDASLMKAVK